MFNKDTDFPQYRKLSNDKVFYRILDDRHFDEIQIVGSRAQLFQVIAEQYPEILRIQDMLNFSIVGYEVSNKLEFESLMERFRLI